MSESFDLLLQDLFNLNIPSCLEDLPELIDYQINFQQNLEDLSFSTFNSLLSTLEELFIKFPFNQEIHKFSLLKKYFPATFSSFHQKLRYNISLDYFNQIVNESHPIYYIIIYYYQLEAQNYWRDENDLTVPKPTDLKNLISYKWMRVGQKDYNDVKSESYEIQNSAFFPTLIKNFDKQFPKEQRFTTLFNDLNDVLNCENDNEIMIDFLYIGNQKSTIKIIKQGILTSFVRYFNISEESFSDLPHMISDIVISNMANPPLDLPNIFNKKALSNDEKQIFRKLLENFEKCLFSYPIKNWTELYYVFYLFPNLTQYYFSYFKKLISKYLSEEEIEVLEDFIALYHIAEYKNINPINYTNKNLNDFKSTYMQYILFRTYQDEIFKMKKENLNLRYKKKFENWKTLKIDEWELEDKEKRKEDAAERKKKEEFKNSEIYLAEKKKRKLEKEKINELEDQIILEELKEKLEDDFEDWKDYQDYLKKISKINKEKCVKALQKLLDKNKQNERNDIETKKMNELKKEKETEFKLWKKKEFEKWMIEKMSNKKISDNIDKKIYNIMERKRREKINKSMEKWRMAEDKKNEGYIMARQKMDEDVKKREEEYREYKETEAYLAEKKKERHEKRVEKEEWKERHDNLMKMKRKLKDSLEKMKTEKERKKKERDEQKIIEWEEKEKIKRLEKDEKEKEEKEREEKETKEREKEKNEKEEKERKRKEKEKEERERKEKEREEKEFLKKKKEFIEKITKRKNNKHDIIDEKEREEKERERNEREDEEKREKEREREEREEFEAWKRMKAEQNNNSKISNPSSNLAKSKVISNYQQSSTKNKDRDNFQQRLKQDINKNNYQQSSNQYRDDKKHQPNLIQDKDKANSSNNSISQTKPDIKPPPKEKKILFTFK